MRRSSLLVLAILTAAVQAGCAAPERVEGPNLLLIVVDTLRPDRLPEYGHDRSTSGALAGYLAEAIRFERAYSPASWTRPAVASLMTGVVPARHRSRSGDSKRLPAANLTLAEVLSQEGWSAAGFSHNINVAPENDFDQGFDHFEAYEGGVLAYPNADAMVNDAIRWLAQEHRPFFLYLQPMNPHGPYRVPDERKADLLGRLPVSGFVYQSPGFQQLMLGRTALRDKITPEMLVSLDEQYDTAVRYTLDELGRLVGALRSNGLYDTTWIVLTADHGEELYDHGGFSHGYSLFEESVRVPLFVKPPADTEYEPGVVTRPVGLVDLFPTLVRALTGSQGAAVDGRSLLPLLDSPRTDAELPEAELLLEADLDKRCRARGLVRGRYKLLHIENDYEGRQDELLLFDLTADPEEKENLAERRPELAAELRARMEELFAEAERRAVAIGDEAPVELDRRTLEALGYLD